MGPSHSKWLSLPIDGRAEGLLLYESFQDMSVSIGPYPPASNKGWWKVDAGPNISDAELEPATEAVPCAFEASQGASGRVKTGLGDGK